VLAWEEKYEKGTGIVVGADPVWRGILMHKYRIESFTMQKPPMEICELSHISQLSLYQLLLGGRQWPIGGVIVFVKLLEIMLQIALCSLVFKIS
jgi:hypothetical protein